MKTKTKEKNSFIALVEESWKAPNTYKGENRAKLAWMSTQ